MKARRRNAPSRVAGLLNDPARKVTKALVKRASNEPGGLAFASRMLPGGKKALVELARSSSDPKVQEVVKAWDAMTPKCRSARRIEDLCTQACISPGEFLGRVAQDAHDTGLDVSRLILGVNHPRVLEKSIRNAMTTEGFKDREMLMKASGFLPTPAGPQITNNVMARAQAGVVTETPRGLRPMEEEMVITSRGVKGS
jgi:hypothetical protein